MPYNLRTIITDKDGRPISQYFNPSTEQYEPTLGAAGASRVTLYNADGTENTGFSLVPILDKLSQLTGTVIDEETRKSNELQRVAFYEQLQQMLASGELKGDKGTKGDAGPGLEFDWQGTQLGVRIEGDAQYVYVELKGPKGDPGDLGTWEHIADKPTVFPPEEHTHKTEEITDWPNTFPPSEHEHTPSEVGLTNVTNNKQMPIAGGTFTGQAIAQTNTAYTTAQLRNIRLYADGATVPTLANGSIALVYEV